MKIIKSFNVKLTKVQVKQIQKQLRGVKESFAILAQPRIKISVFTISNPSMDVAIVDDALFFEINQVLKKAKCEPQPKS